MMSLGKNPTFEPEDARKKAEKILRFKIGPQYSLGEPDERDDKGYNFPILISLPRVLFNDTRQKPVDVKYLEPREVGTIEVLGPDEAEWTLPQTVYSNVRDLEAELQKVVEKALISAAAKDFTKLPFPENRFAPVEDLLSKIILNGSIPIERLSSLSSGDKEDKYTKHLNRLEEDDLIRRENGKVVAGDVLAQMMRARNTGDQYYSDDKELEEKNDVLNAALAHFFEENINNLDDLHEALSPYLAIAGFYYRLAVDAESLPVVSEQELKDAFVEHYKRKGQQSDVKEFKMARYLLHLERAGILKSTEKTDGRVWSGSGDIMESLGDTPYLGTIANA